MENEFTLGSLQAKLAVWFREPIDEVISRDAINDGIESLWETLMQIKLSDFVGGPVSVTFAAGSERNSLVSIPDPVALAIVASLAGAGSLPLEYWDCRITLVTESGSETLVSPKNVVIRAAGGLLRWSSPIYVPGATFPAGLIGYNVYAGLSDVSLVASQRLCKQNTEPIPLGDTWTEPDPGGLVNDPDLPSDPLANTTGDNLVYIKKLEVQRTDGSWQAWTQSDLDSLAMRRASASLAGSDPARPYAFDFLNGETVEIRPAAGATLTPRYFFVQRQRRLRFASCLLPFANISSTIPFLREFALSKCAASVYETDQASTWRAGAEATRKSIMDSQAVSNIKKDRRITPFMR